MIDKVCELSNYQHIAVIIAVALLEYWLGKTDKTKSGSIIEFLINILVKRPTMVEFKKESIRMEKAYDLKELGKYTLEESKKLGLPLAEELAEKLGKANYLGLKKWLKESALISENKIDDVVAAFYDQVDPYVLPLIEKIDIDGDGK